MKKQMKIIILFILIFIIGIIEIVTKTDFKILRKEINETKTFTSIENDKFIDVALGLYSAIAIDSNGNLWSWGNQMDNLGRGNEYTSAYVPTLLMEGKKFKKVAKGRDSSYAIDSDGNLWVWGSNDNGQLGLGTSISVVDTPQIAKSGTRFTNIVSNAAAAECVLAIDDSGYLWACGDNGHGTFGNGTKVSSNTFVKVMGDKTFKEIAAGTEYTNAAIDTEGNLWVWGYNQHYEAETEKNLPQITPVIAKSDTKFNKVAMGNGCIYAIDTSKKLWACGKLDSIENFKKYTSISTSYRYNEIYANYNNVVAIDSSGQLHTWGDNSKGQLGNGTTTTETGRLIIMPKNMFSKGAVAGYGNMCAAIDINKKLWMWGYNASGQIGYGHVTTNEPTPVSIAANKTYLITYDGQGADTQYEKYSIVSIDTEVPELSKPKKTGYTFKGWFTEEYGQGKEYKYKSNWDIASDTTLYAYWESNEKIKYKIEHYKQNLEQDGYDLIEEDIEIKEGLTNQNVQAIAKSFDGFKENTEYSERVPSGKIVSDGSLVLKLYYDRERYTITINEEDGILTEEEKKFERVYGEEITLPSDLKKDGYTFKGWYDNEQLEGNPIIKIEETDIGDKTLYPKWEKKEDFYIKSEIYEIEQEEKIISRIKPETTIETFLNNISTNGTIKSIVDKDGNEIKDNKENLIGTGFKIIVEYEGETYTFENVVTCDLNGDGKVTASDLTAMNKHIVGMKVLDGAFAKAADTNFDKKVTAADLTKLNKVIVGLVTL